MQTRPATKVRASALFSSFVIVGAMSALPIEGVWATSPDPECRAAVRTADGAAQEVRRAIRSTGHECREPGGTCTETLASLQTSLDNLQAASDSLATACGVDGSSPVSPQAGELVITEINAAAQAGRQWFEVFNASTRPLELLGLTVAWRNDIDGAETAGSIVGGVTTVQPGSFRVIGFHEALTSNTSITDVALIDAPLFEVSPGVFVGGMHAAGYLTVLNGTQLIDTVKWTTSEFAASENMKARQLDPDAFTAALNDHVNVPGETNACATPDPLFGQCVWCPATMTYSADGGSAYGTPTGENTQCPGVGPTP